MEGDKEHILQLCAAGSHCAANTAQHTVLRLTCAAARAAAYYASSYAMLCAASISVAIAKAS